MHEWVGRTWHLKIFYCPNRLGISWDAKKYWNRKLQKTWLVMAILNFAQKCKQTAVSQKLCMVKIFCLNIFFISWGALTFKKVSFFEVPSPAHSLMHQQLKFLANEEICFLLNFLVRKIKEIELKNEFLEYIKICILMTLQIFSSSKHLSKWGRMKDLVVYILIFYI